MTHQEAYSILDINSQASMEKIKQAYKVKAKKYHPDIYQGDKKFAEEKMKQINEAFATLSVPNTYSSYQNSNYQSSNYAEHMNAKKEQDEYWKKVQEDLERIQKEIAEERIRMQKIFNPICILLIISLIMGFILLFKNLISFTIFYFNQSNWFSFGFHLVGIITSVPFCFICFIAIIWLWKKMFKNNVR